MISSSLWQLVFISLGCVLILLEVLRGWRRGLARQLARLGALIAAYFAAYFGGTLLGPWGRFFVKLPNPVLSLVVGAFLGLLVYAIISGLGTVLFRKTSQLPSAATRLLYGVGGAVLGVFFGAFLVWIMVVAVRSLGAVAEARVQQESGQTASTRILHPVDRRNGAVEDRGDSSLMTLLARMKNSLELGPVGSAVKKVDVVPTQTYDTLGRVARTLSDPENAERFLAYPGARELADNPKIVALRDDPEIMALVSEGRFFELLQNQKILDAANDPTVVKNVKAFDLNAALDCALKKNWSHTTVTTVHNGHGNSLGMHENQIARLVLDGAFVVHSKLGPGIFESVYEVTLAHELSKRDIKFERQKMMPIIYDGIKFEEAFRTDLIAGEKVIVELKSVEKLSPVHAKQLLTQLRLSGLKLGLLINFGEAHLRNGIKRLVNGTLDPEPPEDSAS